jgi:hypothetical protein
MGSLRQGVNIIKGQHDSKENGGIPSNYKFEGFESVSTLPEFQDGGYSNASSHRKKEGLVS